MQAKSSPTGWSSSPWRARCSAARCERTLPPDRRRLVRCRLPVRAGAHRDAEGDAEVDRVRHFAADQFLRGRPLTRSDLQDDFVVDLEGHALGRLTALTIVAVEVGQVAAAPEERRRVARGPRLVDGPAQIVPYAAETL